MECLESVFKPVMNASTTILGIKNAMHGNVVIVISNFLPSDKVCQSLVLRLTILDLILIEHAKTRR